MYYHDLLVAVADHVRWRGVEVEWVPGPPLTEAAVEQARRLLTIPLPQSLADFYQDVGDGVLFRWPAGGPGDDERDEEHPFAMLELPPLLDLAIAYEEQKDYASPFEDDLDYRRAADPQKARATARRMRRWLAFHHEGNGDRFCLDTALDPQPVVFDRHDWFDGGDDDNRSPMGDTFGGFMTDWARVCFQRPSSLWWPSVLGPAGVDWQSGKFDPRFRLPRDLTDYQLRLWA
jgi:hypothetical protein